MKRRREGGGETLRLFTFRKGMIVSPRLAKQKTKKGSKKEVTRIPRAAEKEEEGRLCFV